MYQKFKYTSNTQVGQNKRHSFLLKQKGMKGSLASERENKQKKVQNTAIWWLGKFFVKYGT